MTPKKYIYFIIFIYSISIIFIDCNSNPKPDVTKDGSAIDPFPKEMLNHNIFKVFRGENRLGYTFRDENKQLFGTRYWQGQESTSPGTDQTVKFNKNQAGGLSTRLPTIGSVDANYKDVENFKVILKGLKIHELKQPALFDKFIDNDNAKTKEYIISMLSAEKIVIQIQNEKGANLDIDTGIADVFSTKLDYSKELEGVIAAENVFIGYITVKPSDDDIAREASTNTIHKSSNKENLQLAVFIPKNKTGNNNYNWLGSSMKNKIEMAFQRIPKFYVITDRKEDARYKINGIYTKIGSRIEIDLNLVDSFRNNEQLCKFNNSIMIKTVDELYQYQITVVNEFVKPLGIIVKEQEQKIIKKAIKTTENIELVKIFNNASILYDKAKYKQAEYFLKTILSKEPKYIDAINKLGHILYRTGKYKEALNHFINVLEIATNLEDKVWIARSYNNIGIIYNDQRKYQIAFEYYFKALKFSKEILGNKHPYTAGTYNNIGLVFFNKKNYDEALEYYFKALKIREEVLGKQHTDTAMSYNNIGVVYKNQRRYVESLEYYFKALKIREEILGKQHPLTKIIYRNISLVYGILGDDKSEGLNETQRKLLNEAEAALQSLDDEEEENEMDNYDEADLPE